jgi:hypothetical protein
MSHSLLQKSAFLWNISRRRRRSATNLLHVTTKYYTHFVTHTDKPRSPGMGSEWSGVVELREPLTQTRANRELRALIAQSFDLDSDDIRILHWARLH